MFLFRWIRNIWRIFGLFTENHAYRRFKFFRVHVLLFILALIIAFLIRAIFFDHAPAGFFLIVAAVLFFVIRPLWFDGVGQLAVMLDDFIEEAGNDLGGHAKFAGMFEEYQNRVSGGQALYYGRSMYNRLWKIGSIDDRHMLTIAGSRAGKGTCVIIPNLLTWEGSAIVIDPKGTNTRVTARHRLNRLGQKVFVFDPFNIAMRKTSNFNPLTLIDINSITVVEDIRIISEALVPSPSGDSSNEFFYSSARDIISGYIAYVMASGKYKNPSLIDVYNLIRMPSSQKDQIHGEMMASEYCGGLAKDGAARMLDAAQSQSKSQGDVLSTLRTNLSWMASPAFSAMLSKGNFSFELLKRERATVYLVIPPDMLRTHSAFIRLFLNVAINQYSRGGRAEVPGLFIIDEANSLGYMQRVATAYGEMASYNMVLWTFFQNKGQLDKLYGAEAGNFISNSRAVQVFAISNRDSSWVSDMLGTKNLTGALQIDKSTNVGPLRDAISAEKEISRQRGRQYILRQGQRPMVIRRMPYYESHQLALRAFRDPEMESEAGSPVKQGVRALYKDLPLDQATKDKWLLGVTSSGKSGPAP